MSHEIILPNKDYFERNAFRFKDVRSGHRICAFSSCLEVLEKHRDDVAVVIDNGKLEQCCPKSTLMTNQNGGYSSFFMVDNNLFMIIDTDTPFENHQQWVKYYEDNGVRGYFLYCHRHSTKFIFDNCSVPVFPLAGKPGHLESMVDLIEDHPIDVKKDINVFFQGRFGTRLARKVSASLIAKSIPNCHIQDSNNWICSKTYIEKMCRSKIVWCPRSAWSRPDPECNSCSSKEFEGMRLECMVLKHPIGTIEVEERIPGIHFVEVKNSDEDLIKKIQYYLENEDERKEIAHNGRLYFERNCTTTARAFRIFNDCLSAIDMYNDVSTTQGL